MDNQGQRPCRILVVDDEPDIEPLIRQRMRRQVRAGTYELCFAGDGAEAVEVLEREDEIDMVVTDINMPRMDGLALLAKIPTIRPDIRAIVVSAYGDMGNIRSAMNRGAFDFVTKPLDFNDFEVTLERTRAHIVQLKEATQSRERLSQIQSELDLASRMQQAILPVEFPGDDSFDVHAEMVPAKNVGGDFFDVITLEHGRIGVAVADVSDKGVPAALFMMSSRTMLKAAAIGQTEADRVLGEVNAFLHADNRNVMFVTIVYVVYEPASGVFSYANGGHCAPLIVHSDGSGTELPGTGGVALGLSDAMTYTKREARLAPGETLIMYSDGVSEALNAQKEEFGVQRLGELFHNAAPKTAQEANTKIMAAVRKFAGDRAQSDDITCLSLHRKRAISASRGQA